MRKALAAMALALAPILLLGCSRAPQNPSSGGFGSGTSLGSGTRPASSTGPVVLLRQEVQRLGARCRDEDLAGCQELLDALLRLCAAGDDGACTDLAGLYLRGLAVARTVVLRADPEAAAELLQERCDAGCGTCCSMVGFMFLKGDGVAQDIDQAARGLCSSRAPDPSVELLNDCVREGDRQACAVLEICCQRGNLKACGPRT